MKYFFTKVVPKIPLQNSRLTKSRVTQPWRSTSCNSILLYYEQGN